MDVVEVEVGEVVEVVEVVDVVDVSVVEVVAIVVCHRFSFFDHHDSLVQLEKRRC